MARTIFFRGANIMDGNMFEALDKALKIGLVTSVYRCLSVSGNWSKSLYGYSLICDGNRKEIEL
jgi:hypothetical protein